MKRQRNFYTVEEKQKAVGLAYRTSNSYAANYYSLDLTMLGRWVKIFSQNPLSFSSLKNTQSIGSGCHALFSEEEAQLFDWIMGVRQNAHIMDSIKAALYLGNTDFAIISGGLTSIITKKGNLKRADLKTEDISKDVIICTFKKYGISNCLSGSEDHLIYDDDDENNFNENSDGSEYEDEEERIDKELDKNEESDEDDKTEDENEGLTKTIKMNSVIIDKELDKNEESDEDDETGDENKGLAKTMKMNPDKN
ncbi:3502_t:CDS:2 [Gigaspora margarita]|uniref:3502_t:CDS:1 n=1 Tax=Gigaspora margarita TaxID=4874 RepID=A0ABN7VM08_GIGMA|nr:3502_t:CDS:2 [Gigaspora margarita]